MVIVVDSMIELIKPLKKRSKLDLYELAINFLNFIISYIYLVLMGYFSVRMFQMMVELLKV